MKKLMSIALVLFLGISVSSAQIAGASVTNSNTNEQVNVASPVVKAVDVNVSSEKCTTAGKSCCNGASKSSAIISTSTGSAEAETTGQNCKSVSVGMSAAKPESTSAKNPKE